MPMRPLPWRLRAPVPYCTSSVAVQSLFVSYVTARISAERSSVSRASTASAGVNESAAAKARSLFIVHDDITKAQSYNELDLGLFLRLRLGCNQLFWCSWSRGLDDRCGAEARHCGAKGEPGDYETIENHDQVNNPPVTIL